MRKFKMELSVLSGNAMIRSRTVTEYGSDTLLGEWSREEFVNAGDTVMFNLEWPDEPDLEIAKGKLTKQDILRGNELYKALDEYLADLYAQDKAPIGDLATALKSFGIILSKDWTVK